MPNLWQQLMPGKSEQNAYKDVIIPTLNRLMMIPVAEVFSLFQKPNLFTIFSYQYTT